MVTLIDVAVHLEPVFLSGAFHELPETGSSRRGDLIPKVALHQGNVFQVFRDPFILEDGFDDGEPTVSPLVQEDGMGLPIGVHVQFPVQFFPDVKVLHGHGFPRKIQGVRELKRKDPIMLLEVFFVGDISLFLRFLLSREVHEFEEEDQSQKDPHGIEDPLRFPDELVLPSHVMGFRSFK
jgi:hypothetical protein